MSKSGKILFVLSFLFLLGLCIFRFVYAGWHSSMWVPLVLGVGCFVFAVVKDLSALKSFFGMRTTKHGMNMGAMIATVFVALICVNVIASRYEKTFDWTSEKLNSLSDQSVKAAQSLTADTKLILLYKNDKAQGEGLQRTFRDLSLMYTVLNPKLTFESYNALQRPDLAQKYEFTSGDSAFYAVQGDQKQKIDQTTEEGVTRALVKFGRTHKKVVYYLQGHGERDFTAHDEDGLSTLQEELSITYDLKPLTLFQVGNKIPDDASVVAVIRPTMQFLPIEIEALKNYAKSGGSLFMAIDPGVKQNLTPFMASLGVEYDNDYILDIKSQAIGGGVATVLGTEFSATNEITRAIPPKTFAIFHVASSLKRASGLPTTISVDEIVRTDEKTMTVTQLSGKTEYKPDGPHTVAIASKGRLAGETEKTEPKPFSAVIYGDSDFLSNRIIHDDLNRDLGVNTFASLANDTDLISIRPKEPKGTKLEMTRTSLMLFVFGFLCPLPVLMFLVGGVTWWRRRAA